MIKNYICIPYEVLFDENISDGAKKLYGLLSNICSDNNGICKDSNDSLSSVFNVVGHTITRWVKELEKADHISCKNTIRSYLGSVYETRIITLNHAAVGYENDAQIDVDYEKSVKPYDVQNYTSCDEIDENINDVQKCSSCDTSDMMYKNVHHYKHIKPIKHINNKTLKSNNKNISENRQQIKPPPVGGKTDLKSSKNVSSKTPQTKPKLFSSSVTRSTKKDKWMKSKLRILETFDFSDNLESLIIEFLEGLIEMDALIPDNAIKMQLQKLQSLPGEGERAVAVETTVTNGWKSLSYAIDNIKNQGKPINKRFDDGLAKFQPTQAEYDKNKEELQRLNREGKLKWV